MGQVCWDSSPGQSFGTTMGTVVEAGAAVFLLHRGGAGAVWPLARCFSAGQRLLGGPKPLQRVKTTKAMWVAKDLWVVAGSLCV